MNEAYLDKQQHSHQVSWLWKSFRYPNKIQQKYEMYQNISKEQQICKSIGEDLVKMYKSTYSSEQEQKFGRCKFINTCLVPHVQSCNLTGELYIKKYILILKT